VAEAPRAALTLEVRLLPNLYHAVPDEIVGGQLHPLARLREIAPLSYEAAVAKYRDDPRRALIPRRHIAKINCIGEDVINLSPIDPRAVHRAWRDLGVDLAPAEWFAIPAERLDRPPAVMTRPDRMTGPVGEDLGDDAVSWFDPDSYRELTQLPERTRRWCAELAASGRRGAWFVGVPHVLVKGSVPIAGLERFDWRSR